MSKHLHCDRCGATIGKENNWPRSTVEMSRTFLEDKGLEGDFGTLHVEFKVTAFDGEGWPAVDLCGPCLTDLITEAAARRIADVSSTS